MKHDHDKPEQISAFPREDYQCTRAPGQSGMTLRDYFAAKALQGIMANPVRWQQIAEDYKTGKKTYEECSTANATKAYSLADAMLAAREATA